MTPKSETPNWWPAGVLLQDVRACNCDSCRALLDAYADWRQDTAPDGEHHTLEAF